MDSRGHAINTNPAYDALLNAEIIMQNGNKLEKGKIVRRALGPDGTPAGTYDEDPNLNLMVYEVEFPDGMIKEYAANVIAQNILSQVD